MTTTPVTTDLVDVTLTARDLGYRVEAVRLDRRVHDTCVAWDYDDQDRKVRRVYTTAQGRLDDLLTAASFAVARGNGQPGAYPFTASYVPREGRKWGQTTMRVIAVATPDHITIYPEG